MKKLFLIILLLAFNKANAQDPAYPPVPPTPLNVVKAEYFFDTDPGFGLAINIPITAATDIVSLIHNVNISALSPGVHRLGLRSLNAEGEWSITSMLIFSIDPNYPTVAPAPLNIVKAEYFIDTDPGFGLGVNIPITAATDIVSLIHNVNISALSTGVHKLGLRSLNTEGEWSITSMLNFSIDPNYPTVTPAPLNIVKAEYFIDTDPGFGLGVDIPITAATDIPSLIASVNISALTTGAHTLGVRSRNVESEWSITSMITFSIDPGYPPAPPAPQDIVAAEYFIDNDPGFGNGTNIPITPAVDIVALPINVNTNLLTPGTHNLYLRSKNNEGEWSITSIRQFIVDEDPIYPPTPNSLGNITFAEYFFDTDPGFGNGTSILLTPNVDIANLTFAPNTSALTSGVHRLYIRSLDDWSITSIRFFDVLTLTPLRLLSFDAYKKQSSVLLKWKTDNEVNTSHFDIERSSNGVDFIKIGEVAALNTNGINDYTYEDLQPLSKLNFYRLKQVDKDAKKTYSNIAKVLFTEFGKPLNVYPNPASSYVQFDFVSKQKNILVNVFDISGRWIETKVVLNQAILKLPVNHLPQGKYVLQLSDGEVSGMASFIKQ